MRRTRRNPFLTVAGLAAADLGLVFMLFNVDMVDDLNGALIGLGIVLLLFALADWLLIRRRRVPSRATNGTQTKVPVSVTPAASRPNPSGTLRSLTGRKLSGGSLTVIGLDGTELERTLSDDEGNFTFSSLPNGRYSVLGMAEPYQPAVALLEVQSGSGIVDLVLRGTTSIVGRAVAENSGAPIIGAHIELRDADGSSVAIQRTGSDGRFRLNDVEEGVWELFNRASHYETTKTVMVLTCGEPLALDLRFRRLAAIHGQVVQDGEPTPWAQMALLDPRGAVVARTQTDQVGRFSFNAVPSNRYIVVASTFDPCVQTVIVAAGASASCSLPGVEFIHHDEPRFSTTTSRDHGAVRPTTPMVAGTA